MAEKKMTKKEIEALQAQIKEYDKRPLAPREKRLKINMSFDAALDKIAKAVKPPKKPKK
jgi:hypothetical protein